MDYVEGIKALACGLSTVFLVLILISIIISLFKHLNIEKKKAPKEIVVTKTPVVDVSPVAKKEDDLELVAVITVAIAASLNTTVDKLQVSSFKRISKSREWNAR